MLNTTGTIDEIVLEGERLAVEGKQIIARTEGLLIDPPSDPLADRLLAVG